MICPPCRQGDHGGCPETARQQSGLPAAVLAGSHRCACQHRMPPEVADYLAVIRRQEEAMRRAALASDFAYGMLPVR